MCVVPDAAARGTCTVCGTGEVHTVCGACGQRESRAHRCGTDWVRHVRSVQTVCDAGELACERSVDRVPREVPLAGAISSLPSQTPTHAAEDPLARRRSGLAIMASYSALSASSDARLSTARRMGCMASNCARAVAVKASCSCVYRGA